MLSALLTLGGCPSPTPLTGGEALTTLSPKKLHLLLISSVDQTKARLFETSDGSSEGSLAGKQDTIYNIVFSQDDSIVATLGTDHNIRIYQISAVVIQLD